MLDLLTTSTRTLTLPLPSDPRLADANAPEALALYVLTGDADALVIPPETLMVTVRALSSEEVRACHDAAGRPSLRGEALWVEADQAPDVRVYLDGLSDTDYAAARKHMAWLRRVNAEIVRRACLAFGSSTGAELVEAVTRSPSAHGEAILAELAGLIGRAGQMGKATGPRSDTSSGPASSTHPATSAPDATAPSQAASV